MFKTKTLFFSLLTALCFSTYVFSEATAPVFTAPSVKANPRAVLHTTRGDITIELYPDKAPLTVANFIDYAKNGFYNGVIFHRVVRNMIIQTGGYTESLHEKATKTPILNESKNRLHNERWTVAMARKRDPDSATSQFFINLKLNTEFDSRPGNPGYTVFGKVVEGQYVVKSISLVPTTQKEGLADIPIENIVIERVEIK
jgi:cyclophilin family peptidyl-prolyl cis-trans isomerase